jgi:hypothetical protein
MWNSLARLIPSIPTEYDKKKSAEETRSLSLVWYIKWCFFPLGLRDK